jgi:hypothetical protein
MSGRRVSALYRNRALAEAAAARLAGAGIAPDAISLAQQELEPEAQAGMFDRLAKLIAPDAGSEDRGFVVAVEAPLDRIDAAAAALEAGADRVEMAAPAGFSEQVVEVSETAERLFIQKESFVREEIVMRVQTRERVEVIEDTVRRVEAEIERFGPDSESAADRTA